VSGDAPAIAIEARRVGKRYAGVFVIRGIDLRLPAGSRTALLGANGAGKTTLLGVLSSLISATEGEVRIGGAALREHSAEVKRRIGVLAHRPMLYEEFSPLENLRFFARLYGTPDAEPRIEELLRAVGLWRRRDESTAVFSRGYHQRLAVARALVHAPDVLLLDEPETGLDPEGVALLDQLVLAAPGLTVLASTHRVDRVDTWATGIVRLDRGRVVEDTASVALAPAGIEVAP
jgi:ABC-type multidrug transport system ATPase subunit